ncbi:MULTISPECIES: hypothetical protein [Kitasatospora]|uniref:Uncharacterized protein n=1 Tax=Kitasatospora setae (strain ATCC 33774 / DSM 43861 / JCM 3304 / KCC A-0304 / NBRC 14216 / KM-6054) TaxID=452652 RepID=E4N3D5_KITSK|nr:MULTISPECIES: hypothetical protein [Kitasatospora]BAJ32669.1 hypothetical protein KSE_69110 [Kitasatospora setae KM-6054]
MTASEDGIERRLAAVADGTADRDAVDRWAGELLRDDAREWDEVSVWALDLLHGIDLRPGPGEPYLHDAEQVRGWLAEYRHRRAQGGGETGQRGSGGGAGRSRRT